METNLIKLINQLRKVYTEKQIADLAGVDVSTINRIRNGNIKNPSSKVLVALNNLAERENSL